MTTETGAAPAAPGEPGEPGETGDGPRTSGTLPQLLAWFRPERGRLAAVTALTVLAVGLLVAGPELLGQATNVLFAGIIGRRFPAGVTRAQAIAGLRAHGGHELARMISSFDFTPGAGVDLTRLGIILGWAAGVYVLNAVFSWAQGYLVASIIMRTVYRLRQAAEEKLARLPLRYFDSNPHGDILSRVTNDIDNIYNSLQDGVSQLFSSALTVIGVLGMMFWISPLLAGVSVITIPLAIAAAAAVARRSKSRFDAQWHSTGQLNGLVEETHTGHALVRAYGQRQRMIGEFDRQNAELYDASFRAQFLSGLVLPVINFVVNVNYVAIAALSGYQVATGVLTFGAAQAFIQYSRRFMIPVAQIAGQLNLIQSGLASADRVFAFLDAPEEEALPGSGDPLPELAAGNGSPGARKSRSRKRPAPAAHQIELRKVSFRYDPDVPLIEDFSLLTTPGQTIAIVGPTGAGKTTVINLLMRFYEIDDGQILLNGVDYRELSREAVRGCFGMVLQESWLFGGTIRDNIGYGGQDATEAEIIAAARAAHVDDFVRTLPDGYDTVLDAEASTISSGQKQLLTIARAFLANPGILILDEATSNVDTRTEVMIQDAMARLRASRTSFVIAHRLSTIHDADTIVVMDAGRVVEQGSHAELMGRRGLYHDLYNSQFALSWDGALPDSAGGTASAAARDTQPARAAKTRPAKKSGPGKKSQSRRPRKGA